MQERGVYIYPITNFNSYDGRPVRRSIQIIIYIHIKSKFYFLHSVCYATLHINVDSRLD